MIAGRAETPTRSGRWKRLGAVGLLFFTIKGLVWLMLPAAVCLAR